LQIGQELTKLKVIAMVRVAPFLDSRCIRLVLGWMTVFGGQTTSVFHQAT